MDSATSLELARGESVRFVRDLVSLGAIFDADANAAILARSRAELPQLSAALLERIASPLMLVVCPTSEGRARLRASLDDDLSDELFLWCEVLAELTGAERVGVRLVRAQSPMCPRFHVDRVTLRLVCAYEGAGTELLPHGQVDRRFLGVALAPHASGEHPDLLRPGASVVRAARGDVVLLKGEAWPGNRGRGCVHRSPPSASAARPRVVLTLDPLE